MPLTYCERVSTTEYEQQRHDVAHSALLQLLDDIISNDVMSPAAKQRRLVQVSLGCLRPFVLKKHCFSTFQIKFISRMVLQQFCYNVRHLQVSMLSGKFEGISSLLQLSSSVLVYGQVPTMKLMP